MLKTNALLSSEPQTTGAIDGELVFTFGIHFSQLIFLHQKSVSMSTVIAAYVAK